MTRQPGRSPSNLHCEASSTLRAWLVGQWAAIRQQAVRSISATSALPELQTLQHEQLAGHNWGMCSRPSSPSQGPSALKVFSEHEG